MESISGIIAGLIATSILALVPIIQKDAVDKIDNIRLKNLFQSLKKLIRNKKWFFSFFLMTIGGIFYLISINLVGIGVLQPVMPFGFVVLVYLGKKKLKEHLNLKDFIGILMMMSTPLLLILSSVSDVQIDLTSLVNILRLYTFNFILFGIIIVLILINKLAGNSQLEALAWALITALAWTAATVFFQAVFVYLKAGSHEIMSEFFLLPGRLLAGDTFIFIAVIYSLITIISGIIATLFLQIAFQKGNVTRIQPIVQTVNNSVSILGGIVIFGQIIGNLVFYIVAIVFSIIATFLLARHQQILSKKQEEKL
ncbi:MAG: hypothetical protein ACFFCS_26390 [Candidatus Hodarchaeota archaeon]